MRVGSDLPMCSPYPREPTKPQHAAWLRRSILFPEVFIAFLRRSAVFLRRLQQWAPARFMNHAQLKHQDPTRTVADQPGSPYPTHPATQPKRRVQCLVLNKLSHGARGSVCCSSVAYLASGSTHSAMLPNRRRLGVRLGMKLSSDDYLPMSGDPSRLSRGRYLRFRSASSCALAHGMTVSTRMLSRITNTPGRIYHYRGAAST